MLVGGVDVRDVAPDDLWRLIGIIPQKPYLFTGTVRSNLQFGAPDATDEELWHALEVAQARPFVEAMEGGLDAPIAQGGTNVSGGQRQRLAIARAIARRPSIYLFDDSFSALDYATDAALRAALVPETRDATVVVVAQRVATIRNADRIVVLDDGRIVTGVLKSETPEALEIQDADAKTIRIPADTIEERKRGDVSIMPPGLVEGVNPGDFADLIAYLESLKEVKPATAPK